MKRLIMLATVAAVFVAVGAEPLSSEEVAARRAKAIAMRDKKLGGIVKKEGTQKGQIVYVNCQTKAEKAWIEESVAYFAKETKFNIVLKDGGTFDIKNPKVEGNASLFIVDDASLPALLVAPENRWAMVNIAVVAQEKRPAYFEARVKKELSRGFAFLCGATNSQYPRCLLRGIVDQADLDVNPDLRLPVDLFQRFQTYMPSLGVTPAIYAPYRVACQQGWAPQPTNEVQKAIWDKVHEIPSKPLKIEYNEKRDAGK